MKARLILLFFIFFFNLPTNAQVEPIVVTDFTLNWNIPTERENGDKLAEEELGGYEIRGMTIDGIIVYERIIENGTTLTLKDVISISLSVTNFEIAAFDVNGLYSEFVPIKPSDTTTTKPAKPINLRLLIK